VIWVFRKWYSVTYSGVSIPEQKDNPTMTPEGIMILDSMGKFDIIKEILLET
jgi:hypothetical protein